MRCAWIAAALSLFPWTAPAAADNAPKPIAVLKYELDDKIILLPVSVLGRSAWFAFDSGARHVIIDPRLARDLRLTIVGAGTTRGTGAGDVAIQHTLPISLRLDTARIRADDPWIIDLSKVPVDKRVRGLLGPELLSQYIVKIDPRSRQISLFDPTTFRQPQASAVPLLVEGDRLFVMVTLDVKPGLSVTHKLRVDTGSGDSVNDPIVAQARETRVTTLGNGLGQNYQAVSGRIAAVHLGPFTVDDVWAPGGTPASIGMEILRRFVVTFDAPHGKMYLKPIKAFKEPVPPPTPQ
jgi:hypothetical protein